ncbi:hypothetical protein [Candidatus Nitrosocosmicus sp. T]
MIQTNHYITFNGRNLPYHRAIMKVCGLSDVFLQDRRIFDRSLKTFSIDRKKRIVSIGNWFISEDLINPYILVVDSSLIKSYKGKV